MNAATYSYLKKFIGKVCTIITMPINRNFSEKISREYFVVRVEGINEDGVFGSHPYNELISSFFCFQHIVSIHEEYEVDLKNPEDQKMVQEFQESVGSRLVVDINTYGKLDASKIINPTNNGLDILQKRDVEKKSAPSQNYDLEEGAAEFVHLDQMEKLIKDSKKMHDAQKILGN